MKTYFFVDVTYITDIFKFYTEKHPQLAERLT